MGLVHLATISPTKEEAIAAWLPTQPWAPATDETPEVFGAYRLDDPDGEVGIEVHLVRSAGVVLQVPLTYRAAALEGAETFLVCQMEHSALGTRWIYDGLGDPVFHRLLATVTLTGLGQAVMTLENESRWLIAPPNVLLTGGGWSRRAIAVDRFELVSDEGGWATLKSDTFELRVAHVLEPGEKPAIGLTGRWKDDPTEWVLAEIKPVD